MLTPLQAVRAASDSRSLVLLDEVGTGTEPVEGSALGVALLETLVKGGRGGAGFTMATTHHRLVHISYDSQPRSRVFHMGCLAPLVYGAIALYTDPFCAWKHCMRCVRSGGS